MTLPAGSFIKPAIFLIILIILCIAMAGCASTTGAQPASTTPATPEPTISSKYLTKGPTPVSTPPAGTITDDGSKTCSQLQGAIAVPGQICPGTWLTASDSFSCCSKIPVAGTTAKPGLAVEPLDLRILHPPVFVGIGTG